MASTPTTELDEMMMRYILTSAVASITVLIMVAFFIYWYIGGLTRVLHDVRHVLLKVSEGDLSDERLRQNRQNDEFGELAAGTEKLRIKIDGLLNNIQQGMLKLTEAVERLNTMSSKNVTTAKEMSHSIHRFTKEQIPKKPVHAARQMTSKPPEMPLICC